MEVLKHPAQWRTTPCRRCCRPIIWTELDSKASMPVDAAPSTDGTYRLLARVDEPEPFAIYVGMFHRVLYEGRLHAPHPRTCPVKGKKKRRGSR